MYKKGYPVANLSEEDIKRIKEVEKELGVILIAYKTAYKDLHLPPRLPTEHQPQPYH